MRGSTCRETRNTNAVTDTVVDSAAAAAAAATVTVTDAVTDSGPVVTADTTINAAHANHVADVGGRKGDGEATGSSDEDTMSGSDLHHASSSEPTAADAAAVTDPSADSPLAPTIATTTFATTPVQQQQMQQQAAFQDQLQQFQAQFQLQLTTQQQRHRDDIEVLRADQRRSVPAPSAFDEASANRRSTFFSGHEHDAGDVEKQLKCFTCEARFHGRDGECIDAFLTTLERALGLKDKQLWVLFLDRQLSGPAASAFQQQCPTLDSVTYSDAAAFLRLRHRPMRHVLETITSILRAKQSSSVTALFAHLETRTLRLSHAGCTPDDVVSDPLLVAVVMSALGS